MATREDLHARIKAVRFYDIAALARKVKGESLGFDVNRKWQAPDIKGQFADWLLSQDWADFDKIEAELPAVEAQAEEYYRKNGKPGRPKGYSPKKAPTPTPKIEDVPAPAPQWEETPKTERLNHDAPDVENLTKRVAAVEGHCDRVHAMHVELARQVERLDKARGIIVTVKNGEKESTQSLGRQHKDFNRLLKLAATRANNRALNLWLTGPAGSGKTTAAENVAKALDLPFHFTGAIDNEYKLLGFVDANGKTVRTAFREAYEHGGIFLLDEVDGCHPGALLALNAALANGWCDFADTKVARHADCVIMAAANTWGSGATHEYVGRTKLDSASLDRFVMLPWEYDEDMERDLSGNLDWCAYVHKVRRNVQAKGVKHIVSPRAVYVGATLLAAGFDREDVVEMTVRKGMTPDQWSMVR